MDADERQSIDLENQGPDLRPDPFPGGSGLPASRIPVCGWLFKVCPGCPTLLFGFLPLNVRKG
jgi:hypothetical protein